MTQPKSVPREWRTMLDKETISRCISRMSYEILEKEGDISELAIVGIKTGGEVLGKRIQQRIQAIEGTQVPFGVIDITLYRDDIGVSETYPTIKDTDLPFRVTGSRIILVDDVLYTGRTIRAALDAIMDFGRPHSVELAVLVDRGHRELPIRPDYVGKNVPTSKADMVRLRVMEMGYEDSVYLVHRGGDR